MQIVINTVPHDQQRYDTVGDWLYNEDGNLVITVSDMQNDDYAFLVGIHEAIEAWFCRKHGIPEEVVSDFDRNMLSIPGYFDEPGDHPDAPYREEHFFATTIERFIAQALGVDWKKYEIAVNSL